MTTSDFGTEQPPALAGGCSVYDDPQPVHYARAKALRPEEDLNEAELKVWDKIAPRLAMLNRLKPHFVLSVGEYCRIVRRMADARAILDKEGWTYSTDGRNGEQAKSRPEVGQLNDDWRKWWSLTQAFGMMASTDKRLSGTGNSDPDEFDSF